MKFLFLFSLLAFVGCILGDGIANEDGSLELGGAFESIINSTINGILANLTDPIEIPNLGLDFSAINTSLVTGHFNLSAGSLSGIKKLCASYIQLNIFSLALNMTIDIPELILKTNYDADFNLASLIPLYGNGLTTVVLDKLRLNISGKANLSPLKVSNITVVISLGDVNFNFNGLLNNPEFSSLINQLLNDNVLPFINNNQVLITKLVSGIIEQLLNAIFPKASSAEVYEKAVLAIRNSELGQQKFITVL